MFRDIIGHITQKRLLGNLRTSGQIPQALLFEGSEGIGKQLIAKSFALDILENDCNRLRIIERLPDKKVISIEQIRELKGDASMTGFVEGARIYLINEAEKLSIEAANSLLKLLEEPPSGVYFFLITGAPESIPETVLSRVIRLKFDDLPRSDVAAILVRSGTDEDFARHCTDLACGNVAIARALCHYGAELLQLTGDWYSAIIDGGYTVIYEIAEQLAKTSSEDKERARLLLMLMRLKVRDSLYAGCSIDRRNFIKDEPKKSDVSAVLTADNCFSAAERALSGNANFRMTAEKLFIEIQDLLGK